jgi:hypothetical protein
MNPFLRSLAIAAGFAGLSLVFAGQVLGGEAHADGTSATKAQACKLATTLARQDVTNGRVTASHCECLENRDDHAAPWSCSAFVTSQ